MKRASGILLFFIIVLALAGGLLLGTGLLSSQGLIELPIDDLTQLQSALEGTTQQALDQGNLVYSRLADHKPPTGDGELLEGELPEDRLPDAGDLYDFSPELYPYREMLADAEREAYDQIYANAAELIEQLPLHTPLPVDSISRVMSAVFYDHPELFWLETGYRYTYNANNEVVALILSFNEAAGNIESYRAAFNSAAERILAGARQLDSPVEQEKYVHDYLLDHVSYVLDSKLNQSAYSALVSGKSVCAGYARAFQYILLELGIPCYYCAGDAGEPHAWNIVGLDDGFYHVDVAWDDPVGNDSGRRYYNYFNLTDSQIAGDHTRSDLSVNLPACNGGAYSYPAYFGTHEDPAVWAPAREITPETAGLSRAAAISSLGAYYAHCEEQLVALGEGDHSITLLIAGGDLVDEIFRLTDSGDAMQQYVIPAAGRLGLNGYSASVGLQASELTEGYWQLVQQIRLEGQDPSSAASSAIPVEESPPTPGTQPPGDGLDTGDFGNSNRDSADEIDQDPR